MKIAYTICSNNYLAKAISLYKSLKQYNSDYHFVICLADKVKDEDEYKKHVGNIEILPFMNLQIDAFNSMINNYTIIELNTAIKPFIAEFLFNKYKDADIVIYFDPDIMIYSSLKELEQSLSKNSIVLTPHFHTPVKEHIHAFERIVLKVGIYNLGFIAWKRSNESLEMIKWWETRLQEECSTDFNSGLFVDQIWINYVPLYFQSVFIENGAGYNMAYWNFYERTLTEKDNKYYSNGQPLVFFHFSGYNPFKPETIYRGLKYSFESRPDLVNLYKEYNSALIENGHAYFSKLLTYYDKKHQPQKLTLSRRIKNKLIRILS